MSQASRFFQPQLNPHARTSWDGPILVIEDFLLNIDEFRESLLNHGHFANHQMNSHVVDVGPSHPWRQIHEAVQFPAAFNEAIADFQGVEKPVTVYGTNLFYSDMKIEAHRERSSNLPHSDHIVGRGELPVVFNLWLHDGGGGTGFYKCDGHATSSSMNEHHRYFAENYGQVQKSGRVNYENMFMGDDQWELWKVAEMKKNRAFVYCGDFWHRVLIPEGEFVRPHPRFSFLCFSDSRADRFLDVSGTRSYLERRTY